MGRAKSILIKPIKSKAAIAFVKRFHYSGRVVQNSQIHLGVFLDGFLHGVLQFGPPLDRRNTLALFKSAGWGDVIELNRMAFDDYLPRNSESRAISISLKLIKKHNPSLRYVISFADATQCGDGTIYRASGFALTGIKRNKSLIVMPGGEVVSTMTIGANFTGPNSWVKTLFKRYNIRLNGDSPELAILKAGGKPLQGFQLRYIYAYNKEDYEELNVKIIPYSEIKKAGASMYKGKKRQ